MCVYIYVYIYSSSSRRWSSPAPRTMPGPQGNDRKGASSDMTDKYIYIYIYDICYLLLYIIYMTVYVLYNGQYNPPARAGNATQKGKDRTDLSLRPLTLCKLLLSVIMIDIIIYIICVCVYIYIYIYA